MAKKEQVAEGGARRKAGRGEHIQPGAGARTVEKKEAARKEAFPKHRYIEPTAGTGENRKSEKSLSAKQIVAKSKYSKQMTYPA